MDASSIPPPLGERTQIDVRAIERELNELWKHAAGDGPESRSAVTRTCVLNLVVITSSSRAALHITDVIAQLTARHPNRAIVVSAMPGAGAPREAPLLDAWVQAHCQLPSPGRPQVCCEQITIEARGAAVARVPGTVLPLLVPDVPVMLWWPRGEPFDDPLFVKLSDLADRVIVDSATFAAPAAGLARLAQLLDRDLAISDLAWARLTPWRELIAQFFDAAAMLPHLGRIAEVTVEYAARPGGATCWTQALLLVGWLGSRLGWRPAGGVAGGEGRTRLVMQRADGSDVQIELHGAEPEADATDRLASVVLECPQARFSVMRGASPDAAIARAEVAGMPPLQRVVRLEQLSEVDLIAEELRLLGRDHAFEGALRVAAVLT